VASSSRFLEQVRLYPLAAKVLEAAAAGSPAAAEIRARAKTLAALRRFSVADLALEGPRRAVQQLFLGALTGGILGRPWSAPVARGTDRHDAAAMFEELHVALAPLRDQHERDQVSPQRVADVLSVMEFAVDGDAKVGFRVRVKDEDLKALAWYVVMEAGQPRLMAPGPGLANLGACALVCLDHRDADGAALWLRWAAEAKGHPAHARVPLVGGSLQVMAAVLLAEGRHPKPAIPILLAARGGSGAADAVCIDLALMHAYSSAGRAGGPSLLNDVDRLAIRKPNTWDAVRGDPWPRLARLAMRAGGFQWVESNLRPLAQERQAPWQIFDCLARSALAGGFAAQQTLDDALAAATRTSYENPACLTTLAMVYAERGKTDDALETLDRGLSLRGDWFADADWCILGRIAEQYALDDAAAALYRKVPCPALPAADDPYTLAQRRLKVMGRR
jgi:hypothetical protein